MAAARSSAYDKPTTIGDIAISGLVIALVILMLVLLIAGAAVIVLIAASVIFPP